jgi:hypothetical protein
MIVHGDSDDVVPYEHGKALYDALPSHLQADPLFLKGVGHNGFPFHVEIVLLNKISAFLDYHVLARRLWMITTKAESKKKKATTSTARKSSAKTTNKQNIQAAV